MIIKDFDRWNKLKKHIDVLEVFPRHYHEREIWTCSIGVNVRNEYDGKGTRHQRPVLILRGFSVTTCLVVPLTSSMQQHRYRINIGIVNGVQASAVLSQIRVIDVRRLITRICYIDNQVFAQVRKCVRDLL
jgi:mRNA-degrading endonuclease toxin of MazEF toxin-antitoxin module